MTPLENPLLNAALFYARKKLKVLPVHSVQDGRCSCGSPECESVGKHPRVKDWGNEATTDPKQIAHWWTQWPDANVGIATGQRSNVVVVDEDPARGGSAEAFLTEYPTQVVALSGGGGRHLYYAYPDGVIKIPNFAGKGGIDIRGDGGFVVAPPSVHSSGRPYTWDPERIGWRGTPAHLPPEALGSLREERGPEERDRRPRPRNVEAIVAQGVPEGQRNDTMARLVGHLVRKGFRGDRLRKRSLADNSAHFQPPLPEDEVLRVVASIETREAGRVRREKVPESAVGHGRPPRTRRPDSEVAQGESTAPPPDESAAPLAPAPGQSAQTHADRLVEIAEGAELFHTPRQEAYATVQIDERHINVPVRSAAFELWLRHAFYQLERRPPSPQALDGVIRELEARAQFDGPEYPVFVRVAGTEGAIYVDLANDLGEAVEITPEGWQLTSSPRVRFHRPEGIAPLPRPVGDGTLADLRPFTNLPDADAGAMLLGWLVMAIRPKGPYPILILQGQQGSAKSTLSRIVRKIVDPSVAPLRSLPRTEQDLMIGASASWASIFDNLSGLSAELSDALCRLATGSGFATRKLYSDHDQVFLVAERPIVLNGIGELAVRHDLRDRAVILTLPPVPERERRDEETFWREFETALPRLLGALYSAASAALGNVDRVKLVAPPRLVDFARWATAAEPGLGLQPGEFAAAYGRNQQEAIESVIEADPVAQAVRELAALGSWRGTTTDLLDVLSHRPPFATMRERAWPSTVMRLTNWIHRMQPLLRAAGIAVEFERAATRDRRRMISLRLIPRDGVQIVRSVPPHGAAGADPDALDGPDASWQRAEPKDDGAGNDAADGEL